MLARINIVIKMFDKMVGDIHLIDFVIQEVINQQYDTPDGTYDCLTTTESEFAEKVQEKGIPSLECKPNHNGYMPSKHVTLS